MKQRIRIALSFGLVGLVAFLIWRAPAIYGLYLDRHLIAACARDNSNCP
jgi:hypothetical protein